ncbi:unnamed protein product [Ascophyllum nodosum]
MGHWGSGQSAPRLCWSRERGCRLLPPAAAAELPALRQFAACLCAHRCDSDFHDGDSMMVSSSTDVGTVAAKADEVTAVTGATQTIRTAGTRYTIDADIHPDVANVAVKHARQLPRFLENHPISAHTREAYSLAATFVRDFHLSRRDPGSRYVFGEAKAGSDEEEFGGGDAETDVKHQPRRCRGRRPFPVVLDSGCGTGRSAVNLARSHPHLPVLGVDRSAVRLARGMNIGGKSVAARGGSPEEGEEGDAVEGSKRKTLSSDGAFGMKDPPSNLLLLRADAIDLWILASRDGAWEVVEHAILYPNPYPKRSQLRSRWHGHPVFPILLSLGGRITLRSNWKMYLEEVCQAVLAIAPAPEDADGEGMPASIPRCISYTKYGGAATWKNNVSFAERDSEEFRPGLRDGKRSGFSDRKLLPVYNDAGEPQSIPDAVAAAAASYVQSARKGPAPFVPVVPATNFEAKYKAVGEMVYELQLTPSPLVEID